MNGLALVTGAARGIGAACARRLAKGGFGVIVHYNTSESEAEALAESIRTEGGVAELVRSDLRSEEAVSLMCKDIISRFGCPDVIVNNAGVAEYVQFQDISEAQWDRMMDSNVKSAYLVIKGLIPAMIERKSGSIINISSIWGQVGASCEAHYSASKGALIALTKALAKELGPSGIRVNCVAPGCVRTAMTELFGESVLKSLAENVPLGRLASPEDVANAVFFLASDQSSFISAQVLAVNGGEV